MRRKLVPLPLLLVLLVSSFGYFDSFKTDSRISKVEQNQAVMMERITSSLEYLSKLPEAIDSLKTTNIKLEAKIDNVDLKVNGLKSDFNGMKNKVNDIDDDGKINVRQGFKSWFTKNWMYIGLVVLIGGLYLSEIIKNVVS